MQLKCPNCGNQGELALDEGSPFLARGKDGGKLVARCNKCGSGVIKGGFGKAQMIPAGDLVRMKQVWRQQFDEEW